MPLPRAYREGKANFYGFDFIVSPATLIPRPETEQLVEKTVWLLRNLGLTQPRIVDIGTGSGVIAITLKKLLPNSTVVATDVSPEALRVAEQNAHQHQVAIEFLTSHLFDRLTGQFDLIIANLPYVPEHRWPHLEVGVRNFEPKNAIVSGPDGLKLIRQFCQNVGTYLAVRGLVAMETDNTHQTRVQRLLQNALPSHQCLDCPDLAGRHRFVFALPSQTDPALIQQLSQPYLATPSA